MVIHPRWRLTVNNAEVDIYIDQHKNWQDHLHALNVAKSKWEANSNCKDVSLDHMFPPRLEVQEEVAKKTCTGCPTKFDCLYFALVSKEDNGVWGGTTEKQRKLIHKSIDADGFGKFKTEWNIEYETYLVSLVEYLIKHQ